MSESPQESTLPPEGNAVKQGVDWVAKHWVRVRLAHEGMMLEKIQRQNRIVEVNARNTMTGKVDDVTDWPSREGKEMGVDIGDHITHHHYPAPPPLPSPAQQPKSQFPKLLAKVAITAALVGSGAGAGAAMPWLLGMFDKPAPPAVVAPAIGYSDGYMEVEKWKPPPGSVE